MASKIKVDQIEEQTLSAGIALQSNVTIPTGKTLTVTDGIAASTLTGALPAISGASLTALPATLPASSGVNLTALNATNLGSGTVPTARLGSGTADATTFLRGDQSYAAAGGGAWNMIGTVAASDSATLTITGLDSTYDTYAIFLSDLLPYADNANAYLRCGDSSGVDSGATDYAFHTSTTTESSSSYTGWAGEERSEMPIIASIGNAAGEGFGAVIYLARPGDGTVQPIFFGTHISINNTGIIRGGSFIGKRNAVITLDRLEFLFNNGNVVSGRFTVYGVSHA